ncbi:hypothetical protein BX600DRAFT_72808 [Xylariales sp. PMI_506]|nr:hypothetical protein BX600DRAFT_72808 [Xylariales sp. PMI_506]
MMKADAHKSRISKWKKRGDTLEKNAQSMGQDCGVFTFFATRDPISGRLCAVFNLPEGESFPDLRPLIQSLQDRTYRSPKDERRHRRHHGKPGMHKRRVRWESEEVICEEITVRNISDSATGQQSDDTPPRGVTQTKKGVHQDSWYSLVMNLDPGVTFS